MDEELQEIRLELDPSAGADCDPLPAVLAAARALRPGGRLQLLAPYLPSALVELLASEGFDARVARVEGIEWQVLVRPRRNPIC